MTLADLGWSDFFAEAFAPHAAEGRLPARVTLQLKGYYEVTGEFGARLGECTGRFQNEAADAAAMPAIGDWAVVTPQAGDETRASIHALLPRKTRFSRHAAGERGFEQVVAANVDTVLLVSALDGGFSLPGLERYLAAAWSSGAEPVIILNKADLSDDAPARQREVQAMAPRVPVLLLSAVTRRGLKLLTPWLRPGATLALLGASGVGKSTLINRLLGEARQETQAVRATDAKGFHTTTQRELLVLPGGALIIDTPGMRELQPWEAGAGVSAAFEDVAAIAARCRFRDCAHGVEPGCAIQLALADGTLALARWQSFLRLGRATAHEVRRVNPQARQVHKSHFKKLTKSLRQRVREKSGDE